MTQIFISYSHADRAAAQALAEFLKEKGFDVWWDVDLYAGQEFHDHILAQLDASEVAIVIWSETARSSRFVKDEASRAQRADKLISTYITGFSSERLPLGFGTIHSIPVEDRSEIEKALRGFGIKPEKLTKSSLTDPLVSSDFDPTPGNAHQKRSTIFDRTQYRLTLGLVVASLFLIGILIAYQAFLTDRLQVASKPNLSSPENNAAQSKKSDEKKRFAEREIANRQAEEKKRLAKEAEARRAAKKEKRLAEAAEAKRKEEEKKRLAERAQSMRMADVEERLDKEVEAQRLAAEKKRIAQQAEAKRKIEARKRRQKYRKTKRQLRQPVRRPSSGGAEQGFTYRGIFN